MLDDYNVDQCFADSALDRARELGHLDCIELAEKELSLLRTLRNQAVMAFRQASGG